ncbi:hypothetical protein I8H83_03265 [Candidatus Saccharibacteria bacterium]|nr:hypothetical protein [Candidatus Saccharibacteria bacterium]MBH2007596.1 hypothetical protein [Candidatus Saccharibacteria bacterium]
MEFKRTSRRSQKNTTLHPAPSTGGTISPASKKPTNTAKSINIRIDMRNVRLPSKKSVKHVMTSKRLIIAAALIATIAIGGTVAYHYFFADSATINPETKPLDKLKYQTVTPEGKSAHQLGGWQRVSPPDGTPVFAYTDEIDGVRISVSQQPLPEKFFESTDSQLDELAKSFNTTNEIAANGVKVYMGTSSKGPQSVIFIKNGLLILIKSQSKIDDASWARYAESLK